MSAGREHIIAQLQKDILALQGYKTAKDALPVNIGLAAISDAFPNKTFPLGAVHEFVATTIEDAGASAAFISALLSPLLQTGGVLCWIGSRKLIFPNALKQFGLTPDHVIFIDPPHKKDTGWVIEEALHCEALSAVVAEWSDMNFIESRRLQLAVEKSQVTACILRRSPRQLNTTACIARWKISMLSSVTTDDLPGVGFPRWNVELLKVRNGKPQSWQIEWAADHLEHLTPSAALIRKLAKKAG